MTRFNPKIYNAVQFIKLFSVTDGDETTALTAANWNQYKKKFYKQRFLSSPVGDRSEFIQFEILQLNSYDLDEILSTTTTATVARLMILKEKYIRFLTDEADGVPVESLYETFRPTDDFTIEDKMKLHTLLKDTGLITCSVVRFKQAFSGKPTPDPLEIEFNGSAITLYFFLRWLQDKKLIKKGFSAINEKSRLFLYKKGGKFKVPVQLRQNIRSEKPPKFIELERDLNRLF